MKIVDRKLIAEISEESIKSPRNRANKIFHKYEDKVQRMIQVLQPNTYAQPHRHKNPDKVEIFVILEGRMGVVEFDNQGKIRQSIILDRSLGNYSAEIAPGTWHSIFCLEKNTSMVEILEGPYEEMSHKKFAPWAPKEGSPEAREYLTKLKRQVSFF